ncbi:MAG: UDP-N-acetylmuramate:L-alanyl-gamma-D-glutamyl-meso-diaminopimelate ligase [Verrucomicrobiae bacterium]|nr:UDP-N-acetylmuramate:L-alanyl-gamma-D-glutamyl-meso-diaminopimelate ligase [Verrucomicrobiae bacterium]
MTKNKKRIHFVGICGTAMGNVAAMMQACGYHISGSDQNVYPPMSTFLENCGVELKSGYEASHLDSAPDLCVIGNAISRGNPEMETILNKKLAYLSLPEILKEFFLKGAHNLVVTGTHGKTTTSSLLAWIFEFAGKDPSFLIGGLPGNFDRGCKKGKSNFWILEGDEYDTAFFDKRSKFLHYLPELVIINNVEFDHADIYENLAAIQLSFRRLVNLVPTQGMILVNADDPNSMAVVKNALAPVTEVGFSNNAAIAIKNFQSSSSGVQFEILGKKFDLPMHGEFNVRNATMAIAAAHFYQIDLDVIAEALKQFKGVKRRQEERATVGDITIVDDFGHHPTAMKETLKGLRQRYEGRRLWALFEPRSNTTRRAVFQDSLPEALALADGVFVSQVARLDQLPENERLNPEKVVASIEAKGVPAFYEVDAQAIVEKLVPQLKEKDVIIVFSNGGFGGIHNLIEKTLKNSAL